MPMATACTNSPGRLSGLGGTSPKTRCIAGKRSQWWADRPVWNLRPIRALKRKLRLAIVALLKILRAFERPNDPTLCFTMPQAMKIPAWDLAKVRSKKEVIDEARTKGAKVHFASLMDICHLKNVELEAKHQKYKGRVVLRGDTVKDDSGSYAVFTEHHIQTARVRRTSSWCSICSYPGKNWKMLQNYWKFPNRNVQTFGFVYHDTNGRNHGPVW